MQQGGASETDVTWEDQQNINKFGRLNNRFHELEEEIKIAKVFMDSDSDSKQIREEDMDKGDFSDTEMSFHRSRRQRAHQGNASTERTISVAIRDREELLEDMAEILRRSSRLVVAELEFDKLRKLGATDFYGRNKDDAAAAEYWLERTERVFKQMDCTSEQKYKYIESLLQEWAYDWWKMILMRPQTPDPPSWEFFLEQFKSRYVPRAYMDRKKQEFLDLRQGTMTVSEYEKEYTRLIKYAGGIIQDEIDRCRRFEKGLRAPIRTRIAAFLIEDFSRLVTTAESVEEALTDEYKETIERGGRRSLPHDRVDALASKRARLVGSRVQLEAMSQTASARRGQVAGPTPSSASAPALSTRRSATYPLCQHCGRRHQGECWWLLGACMRCGRTDHLKRDCPLQSSSIGIVGTRPIQTQVSVPTRGQGRGQSRGCSIGASQEISEMVDRPEGSKVAPTRVYAMRVKEEEDALEDRRGNKR